MTPALARKALGLTQVQMAKKMNSGSCLQQETERGLRN